MKTVERQRALLGLVKVIIDWPAAQRAPPSSALAGHFGRGVCQFISLKESK